MPRRLTVREMLGHNQRLCEQVYGDYYDMLSMGELHFVRVWIGRIIKYINVGYVIPDDAETLKIQWAFNQVVPVGVQMEFIPEIVFEIITGDEAMLELSDMNQLFLQG